MKYSKALYIHPLVGLLIGYFLMHPISMVIYNFETNNSMFTISEAYKVFIVSFQHSFKLHMMPMGVAFAVLGALGGLASGMYYNSIKKKEYLLYGKKQLLQHTIPSLIAEGENEFVEFKSSLRYDYRQIAADKNLEHVILKTIAGFFNANGGTLIIGVDDNGKILGLVNDYKTLKKKNKDGFQQRIIMLVSNEYGKNICSRIHVSFHTIDEKEICTLIIESSRHPIYLKEDNRTVFYLRTGNVTNPLTTSETVQYLQSRN